MAQDFAPPPGWDADSPLLTPSYSAELPPFGPGRLVLPFLACGDLAGFDSDRAYPAPDASLPPVQPPLGAPFAVARERAQQRPEDDMDLS